MAFTLRLPEEFEARLLAYCARTGASKSGAVLVALERFFANGDLKLASQVVAPKPISPASAPPEEDLSEEEMDEIDRLMNAPRDVAAGAVFCRFRGCARVARRGGFCDEHGRGEAA